MQSTTTARREATRARVAPGSGPVSTRPAAATGVASDTDRRERCSCSKTCGPAHRCSGTATTAAPTTRAPPAQRGPPVQLPPAPRIATPTTPYVTFVRPAPEHPQRRPRPPRPAGGQHHRGQRQRGGQRPGARRAPRRRRRAGWRSRARPPGRPGGVGAARSSSHAPPATTATTTHLAHPHGLAQLAAADQRGQPVQRGGERAVDARLGGPRRLDRAGDRVRAAGPGHRRRDVRVAALTRIRPYAA